MILLQAEMAGGLFALQLVIGVGIFIGAIVLAYIIGETIQKVRSNKKRKID